MRDQVACVRRFNRAVTQRIGVLDKHYLGRGRALGESRLLFEIGRRGAELRELRARLGLDSGYVSRLISSLERSGLVSTEPSAEDRRIRRARLTAAGAEELAELDRLSDAAAAALLEPLGDRQRRRLIDAMEEVERLLSAASVVIERVDPSLPPARWCLEQYYAELAERFEEGFDLDRAVPTVDEELVPPHGAFLLARLDGHPVGCGCLKALAPDIGYLKRMWVGREARGLGLGRRLLAALETQALDLGFTVVRLETNRALVEAQALYRATGYREIEPFIDEPYGDFWFEKRLDG